MKRTRSLVLIALFAAIAAVLSPIRIPLPGGVPLTLQLFAGAGGAVCSSRQTLPGYLPGGRAGLLTSYPTGVPWFAGYLCLASGLGPGAALAQAWLAGTLPFLLPDLAKVACAAALGRLLAARLQVLNA